MNRRERAVLLLVIAAFLVGIGISYYKRAELRHQAALNPIAVVQDASAGPFPDSAAAPTPVDLNRATPHQLDGLPGIGPTLAGRIIQYRERRGGFGEKRYSAMRDLVMVGAVGSSAESGR